MRALAILAAAVVTLAAAPAFAAGPDLPSATQVTVRLGDLDLNSANGAHAAVARLTRAAGEACGDPPNVSPDLIWQSERFRTCRVAVLRTAIARIHTTAVDVAYAQVHGAAVQVAGR